MTAGTRPDHPEIFLEDRTDLRLALDSDGGRDARVTTSRGVAFGASATTHVTDPTAAEVSKILGGRALPGPFSAAFNAPWIEERERSLRDLAETHFRSVAGTEWSATMTAFRQKIWVAMLAGDVRQDVRKGCRYEVAVSFSGHPNTRAVAESVDRGDSSMPPVRAFEWALERSSRKRRGMARAALGKTSAVIAPGTAGIVAHELVGHALEGDVAARRATWLESAGLVAPARDIVVIDDPRLGRGAWSLDDEGVDAQRTMLIEGGRPVGLLLDARAAGRLGRPSTGHGRRASYLDSVRPRMGCTFIAGGSDDPDEILRETRSGVFIHRMTAGHTDPFEGRASFLVTEADRIENGALGEPLQPFMVELIASEAWSSIDRIGRDLTFDVCVGSCVRDGQPLAVSVGAPTIRIGVITVVS